jgi:hypothetical protein
MFCKRCAKFWDVIFMTHLEYKMFFQQMPDYQLLQHYDLTIPNINCYKTRLISLCIQKESYMSDNTPKERYLCRPNLLHNIRP